MVVQAISKTITYADTSAVVIGYLPPKSRIETVRAHVDIAFDSAPDFLSIGDGTTASKYTNDIDLSSIATVLATLKPPAVGVLSSTNSTAIYATVVPGSSSPTAGSVDVVISFVQE